MKLRAPKPTPLRPVRPSPGIEAWYRRELTRLIAEMHKSTLHWVRKSYKPPVTTDGGLAMDKGADKILQEVMGKLGKRWQKQFDDLAASASEKFADSSRRYNETAFRSALKESGFAVKFELSEPMQKMVPGIVSENVDLIKSIPEKYFDDVKARVQESVEKGRDIASLTEHLQERYGISQRRAALIARDQNNKATAQLQKAGQKAVGIVKAMWSHTSASKDPREEHESWDGESYDVDEGMWSEVDQEYVWPGTAINCGCTSHPIIPGYDEPEEEAAAESEGG